MAEATLVARPALSPAEALLLLERAPPLDRGAHELIDPRSRVAVRLGGTVGSLVAEHPRSNRESPAPVNQTQNEGMSHR
jgi:hypothetical protein